ncbi:MAG: acylphosphatase [Ilumatobacteraceae bacterium]
MNEVRCRLLISGRVQGVSYRDSCRIEALRLGVRGWARNLHDGRVEVVAEGAPDAVGALIEWCRQGPPWASVGEVQILDEPVAGEGRFSIEPNG